MNSVRSKQLLVGSLVSLVIIVSIWAQGNDKNPFAPLPTSNQTVLAPPPMMASKHVDTDEDYMTRDPLTVAGILWQKSRPVAIINDIALAIGSRLGTAEVTAIHTDAVELTETSGAKQILYLLSGLSAQAAVSEAEDNTTHLHIHVENVSGRTVLEALAYQAELNLVFVGKEDPRINLHMRNVSWDEALAAVLRAANCVATREADILIVQDSLETQATRTFPLNYGKSKSMEQAITKLLSEGGKLGVDERLNALVVTDSPENLKRIEEAVTSLDRKAPQVLIEVLIVNVILTDERKMGIDWQIVFNKAANEGVVLTQELAATSGVNPYGSASYGFISGDWEFSGLLDVVQSQDDVTVLASPKVFVLNNHTATIDAVEEIPYQELTQTGTGPAIGTTAFKEAGVKLQVTPQITEDGYIVMHVVPEQSAQVGTFTIDNTDTPVVETRKTETNLRVKDGQTVIIGGLRKKEPFRKVSRIPVLADIPLVGKLFQKVHEKEVETELAVFITPRIYRENAPTDTDLALVDSKDDLNTLWNKMVIQK